MARSGRPREFDVEEALATALQLFWEHGYESTSLVQLRSALGISSASFYSAFSSKEDLFKKVVERYVESYGQVTSPVADDTLPPREAIERTLRESAIMQTDPDHPLGCLLILTGTLTAPGDVNVRELLAQLRAANRRNMVTCVERAIAHGELPADTDANALGTMFHTFLVGIATEARDGTSGQTVDRAIDYLMSVWDATAAAKAAMTGAV
jgi:TetR/AcrR family transcriptional repressor for divergent bdcA